MQSSSQTAKILKKIGDYESPTFCIRIASDQNTFESFWLNQNSSHCLSSLMLQKLLTHFERSESALLFHSESVDSIFEDKVND